MSLTVADLTRIGGPLAAQMLPGWSITWEVCAAEDIGGALAMIWPTPKRQMALIKVAPHPPTEDIRESIAHELTHGIISPLVELIEASPASIMLEEPIAERLGKLLSKLPLGLARAARKALSHPRTNSSLIRSRIAALAPLRRRRTTGMLTAEQIQKALDALESGDAEAGKAILKEIIAAMASGGGKEPDGDESQLAKDPADPDAGSVGDGMSGGADGRNAGAYRAGTKARQAVDKEHARARRAADTVSDIAIRARIREVRAEGLPLDAAAESKLLASHDIDAVETAIGYIRMGHAGSQRGQSGTKPGSAGPEARGGEGPEPDLTGLPEQTKDVYRRMRQQDKAGADIYLAAARKSVPAPGKAN